MQTKQEKFKEDDKVTVIGEVVILHGLSKITIRPGDVLRVVGYDRFGEVCARFDNCADLPGCHDALFGKFYIPPSNVVAA